MADDAREKDPNSKLPGEQAEKAAEPSEKEAPASASAAAPRKPPTPATAPPAKPATPAGAAPPRPAAPAKEAPPKPVPLDNELVQRLKARFGEAIREATLD